MPDAALPDPRFRNQLAEAVWPHISDAFAARGCEIHNDDCDHLSRHFANKILPLIAAEVKARVQAAANQRAVEELQAAATKIMQLWDSPVPAIESAFDAVVILRARAAALASPAPAPDGA